VGTTWRYVNKKGGPDRRFARNYEIPIVIYYYLSIQDRSGFGLNEQLAFSQLPALKEFGFALVELSKYPRDAGPPIATAKAPGIIRFQCSACGQPIDAEPDMAGEEHACPTCKCKLRVPGQIPGAA
jgi:DNA-directed RNA polymerase subunit RPC12/RpoP